MGLPPVIVPVNLEEAEEVALVTEKSVETERVPPIFSRDDGSIDWANFDVESFVVPADKVERQRLLRAIRDEITDRQNRQEHYVVAVCFKGQHVDPPDPRSVEIDKLLDLMERFPIVRPLNGRRAIRPLATGAHDDVRGILAPTSELYGRRRAERRAAVRYFMAFLQASFWQRHDGELSDSENEWIADRAEDIWIARSIAYASTMQGNATIGAGKFDDSRTDFGHRLNPPASTPRQPDVTEMDWVVYWWCMDNFEDFQAEWNRLLDWTKRLYWTRGIER